MEIDVFLLLKNLTECDAIYTDLEGFKKGFFKTIEWFKKKKIKQNIKLVSSQYENHKFIRYFVK